MPDSVSTLFAPATQALRAGNAREALRLAAAASRATADRFSREFARSAIEIDAAGLLNDRALLRRAIVRLEAVEPLAPAIASSQFHYNLGNAYLAIGQGEPGKSPGTKPSLAHAVSYLEESLTKAESADARTNLGSALLAQGRWIEALDEFSTVLKSAPNHHNALAMHGSALIGLANWSRNHKGLLIAALNDHIHAVDLAKDEPVYRASYMRVVAQLQAKFKAHTPTEASAGPTARWIWDSRLNLNLCPICESESPEAYDTFPLQGPILSQRRKPTLAELIDTVNSLCRSYGIARLALLQGLAVIEPPEEGQIVSVPSGAPTKHDTQQALVLVAISGFYSVFQQVAYALSSYLHLGHALRDTTFDGVWRPVGARGRGVPTSRSELHPRICRTSCPALSALHHLALSMQYGRGKYTSLRELRNHLEHHIVVPVTSVHPSRYYFPYLVDELRVSALQLGRLARSAIWYFSGTVLHFERQRAVRAARTGRPAIAMPGSGVERL